MKISIEDLRERAGIVGQAGGAQAAIVAQFLVDLAVTGQLTGTGEALAPPEARRLLWLRLARHRALTHQTTYGIH